MKLRSDDPLYYKEKLTILIEQAKINDVKIGVQHLSTGGRIVFIGGNGDTIGVNIVADEKNVGLL